MKTKQHKIHTATVKSLLDPNLRTQIEQRAYEIWEANGGRHGEDITHWLLAETEVLKQRRPISAGRFSANA
jgi:Protein of unknown function (DUF2934)